ncbi:MAG: Smr/MutS family protein [Rubrivivax sp.]
MKASAKPARPLQGFSELAAALRQRARAAEAEAAAERRRLDALAAEQRQRDRERMAFAHAVGAVTLLPPSDRAALAGKPPAPIPRMRQADEAQALKAALSDEVDVESLLLTDDGLSFRRPGISADVLVRLRRGHWAIQRQIDLHGLRRDEARDALALFLRQTRSQGHRCLRVVHGKGLGSPGREPVLKGKVQRWLAQCDEVIAFAQAAGPQGGAGALIVLLAP